MTDFFWSLAIQQKKNVDLRMVARPNETSFELAQRDHIDQNNAICSEPFFLKKRKMMTMISPAEKKIEINNEKKSLT